MKILRTSGRNLFMNRCHAFNTADKKFLIA